jgi:BppU N-terminal domain
MTDPATVSVQAGPYVVGEKPPPLQYTFLDSNGVPIDLSGYTAKFVVHEQFGPATTFNASVTDPSNGVVQYTWTAAEFPTSGSYFSEFWTGNGSVRYASILIKFDVRTAVGPVPSV